MGLLQVSDCKRGAFGEDYGLEFCEVKQGKAVVLALLLKRLCHINYRNGY